jgi:hypothetical protein
MDFCYWMNCCKFLSTLNGHLFTYLGVSTTIRFEDHIERTFVTQHSRDQLSLDQNCLFIEDSARHKSQKLSIKFKNVYFER